MIYDLKRTMRHFQKKLKELKIAAFDLSIKNSTFDKFENILEIENLEKVIFAIDFEIQQLEQAKKDKQELLRLSRLQKQAE